MSTANHFLDGRKYRVDEIGEVAAHRNWWRALAFGELGCIALLILGIVYLAVLRREIPYFIEWNSASGDMRPLKLAPQAPEENMTVHYWLSQFVVTLRAISTDRDLMKDRWNTAMTRLTKEGRGRLVQYEQAFKPLTQQEPVKVEILQRLRQTKRTWDVRWKETRYNAEDQRYLGEETYRGIFTFEQRSPRTTDEREQNPAGIFWHEWSWSPE